VEADRPAAWVERGERARRAADRLRAALERGLGFLPAGDVEDQERRLAIARLLRLEHVPSGAGGSVAQLHRQRGDARYHDHAIAAPGRQRLEIGCAVGVGALRVVVVTATRFPPEPPRRDCPDRDLRGPPAGLAKALLEERARDLEPDIDPDQVHQLERAHLEAAALPADPVDLRQGRGALLQQPQPLEPEWPVAAVHEEAGAVDGLDHDLAHRLAGCAGERQRLLGGLRAGHDLQQRHQRRRIEEVHPHDALGPARAACDRGHQQRGGVGRQHALLGDDPVRQPAEQATLELERLRERIVQQRARAG
jgi:hypothetical protein